jgi:proteasome accessory factor C
MTANAQAQVERMLALVPYLQSRDGISVDEVARDFKVKPAQIVKDLKVLWFCGLPDAVTGDMIDIDMDALDGDGIVRLSNADYLSRPLRLAPHEALALVVALRSLRELSGPGERGAVERAMLKLEAATGIAAEQAAAVDIRVDPVDPDIRATVDSALHERRRLHIHYYVPGRDETTQRDVDPMRLLFSEGQGYLEAWCHRAQESRLFRLDRITAATLLDVPAEPPADARRKDLSQGLFQPDPEDPVAVLDLAASAEWVADYYPIESRVDRPDGTLRVTLRYSDQGWLERLVLRLGGQGTLVEPAQAAKRVRSRARAALDNYSA